MNIFNKFKRLNKYISILALSFKRFYVERRVLWATSLTFTTIFSLIPLLSVSFIFFSVFDYLSEFQTIIQPYIYKTLAPGAQEKVITIINDLVANIDFHTIGVFGSAVLIISVFLLLFEIEYALNEIWLISSKLSIIARAAVYWAALTIGPLLVAVSLFIVTTLHSFKAVKFIEEHIYLDLFSRLSYVLIWIALTILYYVIPGTKVRLKSALFGGVIAGAIWQLTGYAFTVYTSKFFFYYPKVYGSLAAIPLFMLWLFFCWVVFLLGAEMTYFHQNFHFYSKTLKKFIPVRDKKEDITLMILLFISRKFLKDEQPPTQSAIADNLTIPVHIISEFMSPLVKHGILIESAGDQNRFVPAKPLSKIKLSHIFDIIYEEASLSNTYFDSCKDEACIKMLKFLHSQPLDHFYTKSIEELLVEADS